MFNKLKANLARFMYGRYGIDTLSKTMVYSGLVLMLISCFISQTVVHMVLYVLSMVLLIMAYVRMFSKNITKRYNENLKYTTWLNYQKTRFKQRKDYRFFSCPNCHQHLRVPKGAGKIEITCRNCGHVFERKA